MAVFYSTLIETTLLVSLIFVPFGQCFTVIVSDSGLVDAPQTAYSLNNDHARTDPREQEAVYEVMRATGNDWATEIPDVCRGRWHGIECMPDKANVYHVVSLSFGALSDDTAFPTCDTARPFISPAVTKLLHLRTLFFYRCFTDNPQPIPPFLAQLGQTLQTLVLRENAHVGSIPNQLGNLTRLRVLDFHGNNLNGSIPVSLSRISGLRSLDLSRNKLAGSIPNLTFPLLQILDLNQNHLVGSIPTALINSHSLIKMDLSRNRLSGRIPDSIDALKNIILMDLSYNSITGPIPTTLKNLDFLQALLLSGNPMLSDTLPEHIFFDGFKDLMILALSNMNLQGSIPESLAKLPKIRVLHLDGNQFNGSIPASFGELDGLSELRLDNNQLTGVVPFKREMVWRMRRKLKLSNNSGLCYDAKTGLGDDLEAISDSGIGHCGSQATEPARTVEHISAVDESMLRSSVKSGGTVKELSPLSCLLLAVYFL
ncbi:protein TOO MANY MOUTHS [Ipomoea triloba]|uniref:protein TOO MANY MOUTHS n=1 Tax=Ipomoea triloba TaxID=35885 RepID=UPI00125E0129|nr:protein TOO MANY MOUTHS [Ipomoea triloba]